MESPSKLNIFFSGKIKKIGIGNGDILGITVSQTTRGN